MQIQAQNQTSKIGSSVSVKATAGGVLLTQSPNYPYYSQTMSGAGYSTVNVPTGYNLEGIMCSNSSGNAVNIRVTLPGESSEKTVAIPNQVIVPIKTSTLKVAGDNLVVLFGNKQ